MTRADEPGRPGQAGQAGQAGHAGHAGHSAQEGRLVASNTAGLSARVERWLTRFVSDAGLVTAPVPVVWRCFSEFERFPDWNPFIRKATGSLRVGSKLDVHLRLGARLLRFRPQVTLVETEREVRWRTQVLVPGLFDVDRRFRFEPTGPGETRFVQEETNRGLLVPLAYAWLPMERDLLTGFREFREALGWLAKGKAPVLPQPAPNGERRGAGAAVPRAAAAR